MADNVQWLKLKVGMFDGNSFKKIKRAKIGGVSYRDKLTAIWFELLDLAGKSNANGYLIDNNEIPYHTFEDIAVMLDREEKEVELCMQFFISEKMVEIIDDIYCLTNFTKYQNEDGLSKIREQKRISQAKWRERKKLGLIGCENNENSKNVDEKTSTVEPTDHLPSISYSISKYKYIYNKDKQESILLEKVKQFFDDEDVILQVGMWLKHKQEKGQSYKPTGLTNLLQRLKREFEINGKQFVIDEIKYSIGNNYSGIYPAKEQKSKPEKVAPNQYTEDDLKRYRRED